MDKRQEQSATTGEKDNLRTEGTAAMETTVEGKPPEPVRSDRGTVLKSVLASALVTVGMLAAYDTYMAQKIVAVDLKGYIARQRDLFVSGKITEEQLKRNFDRMEAMKAKVPKNRVMIMGDVLVRKNVQIIEP